MSDETGGEAAVVETIPKAAPEAAVSSQETAGNDVEAEARKQGWRPKDEWSGDPDNWKDAKTYVEHGEVKARIARIEKDYAERFERLEKSSQKAMERQKKQLESEIATLKAQKREAVKSGDVEAVERIDAQIEERKGGGEDASRTDEEVQSEWMKANQWFDDDEDLRVAAIGYSNSIRRDDLSMAENLKRVDAYMRKKFPDKFGGTKETKAANGHAAVDGGGIFDGSSGKKGKGPDDLPPEARTAGARFVKQGLFKNLTEYAKDYFDGQ